MDERLQKIISQWGMASRRQAEELIGAGRVRVNGTIAHLGQKADPERDRIEVDGQVIQPSDRPALLYFLIHKPLGVVSTCRDNWDRQTVLDLLPKPLRHGQGLHPIGRLDADSTGALILTNDGPLTFYLSHPRHHIDKTYQVWVQGHPSAQCLQQWRQGVLLDGQMTLPAQVETLDRTPQETGLKITLREGRNRQIRRVAELLGHPVRRLHRVALGPIHLADLPVGHYRPLTRTEIDHLSPSLPVRSSRL